jgi:hypothetical protein
VDVVNQLEQVLQLPGAYIWLPALVFVLVVGAVYWMMRPAPQLAQVDEVPAVQPVVTQKPKDLRAMHRRHGNPVEVHIAPPDKKDERSIGSVLDRSVGGLRLAVFNTLAVGAVFSIRPMHADSMVPWVDVEVRSCRPSVEMPDQFEVGCQYVKSPPYSIQLLFG